MDVSTFSAWLVAVAAAAAAAAVVVVGVAVVEAVCGVLGSEVKNEEEVDDKDCNDGPPWQW